MRISRFNLSPRTIASFIGEALNIQHEIIGAIVFLPRKMFYSTDISVTFWILNNNNARPLAAGRREQTAVERPL
ncbi:MAG: N-6 DNA methylase [Prevotella sp.]|nr:N-6 DNA methylase [Prevotella sp.]MBR7093615.1 N-6 DNA methylase [Prevotella sp.]